MEKPKANLCLLYGRAEQEFERKFGYEGRKSRFEVHLSDQYGEEISRSVNLKEPKHVIDGLLKALRVASDSRILGIVDPHYNKGFTKECRRLETSEGEKSLCSIVSGAISLTVGSANFDYPMIYGPQREELSKIINTSLITPPSVLSREEALTVFDKSERGISVHGFKKALGVPSYVAQRILHNFEEEGSLYRQGRLYFVNRRAADKVQQKKIEKELGLPLVA